GVTGGVPERAGDAGVAGQPQDADDQVAERGHDVRPGAGARGGGVLGEGDVADPVQLVLDLPVAADPGGELAGPGLLGGQAGDHVAGLGTPPAAAGPAGAAGDLDGLGGVREREPGGDGDSLDDPFLDPAVAAPVGHVADRYVLPGQGPELAE